MATTRQHRRSSSTAEADAFTGAAGEITVDLEAKAARVHDGAVQGGFPLARADQVNRKFQSLAGSSNSLKAYVEANSTTVGALFLVHGYSAEGDGGLCFWECTSVTTTAGSSGLNDDGDYQVDIGSSNYAVFRNASPAIHVAQYGMFGLVEEGELWQKALNSSELLGLKLSSDFTKRYTVSRTIYLGSNLNGPIKIKLVLGSGFTEQGTAGLKNEGAILMKSEVGAGYGYDDVDLYFDQLDIYVEKDTSDSVIAAILMSNVSSFYFGSLKVDKKASVHRITPVDWYKAWRNGYVGLLEINNRTEAVAAGGVWMRNNDTSTPSENVVIDRVVGFQDGQDEVLAIYNFDAAASVRNIHIKSISATSQANGVAIMDKYGGADFSNIRVDGLYLKFESIRRVNFFGLKFERTAPEIGTLEVSVGDISTKTNPMYGLRNVQVRSDGVLPKVQRFIMDLDSPAAASTGTVFGTDGQMDIQYIHTSTSGAHAYQRIVNNVNRLESGKVSGAYVDRAVRNALYVSSSVDVHGKIDGCVNFYANHYIDVGDFDNAIWCIMDSNSKVSPTYTYAATVIIEGSGSNTIDKIVSWDDTTTTDETPAFASIKYEVRNPDSVTISNADFVNSTTNTRFKLKEYERKVITGKHGSVTATTTTPLTTAF